MKGPKGTERDKEKGTTNNKGTRGRTKDTGGEIISTAHVLDRWKVPWLGCTLHAAHCAQQEATEATEAMEAMEAMEAT